MNLIEREEYSTEHGRVAFHPLHVQFSNRGEMDAIVDSVGVSLELIDLSTGETFELPEEAEFSAGISRKHIGESGTLTAGSTDKVGTKFNVREVDKLPQEIEVNASYDAEIRDNQRVYNRSSSGSFRFIIERDE
ncbi:hypothetical protein [Halolamina sediminis]|uniref:hypothetical protein n=1 Tax=Halolamina sediminis TaxID=1480675 RepID=UPI0013792197|nr:hypothetical protein [Halolamina sediminis]